jgi:hypothetical protein
MWGQKSLEELSRLLIHSMGMFKLNININNNLKLSSPSFIKPTDLACACLMATSQSAGIFRGLYSLSRPLFPGVLFIGDL